MAELLTAERLALKTLIITGSSGLIGSALIDRVGDSYWETTATASGNDGFTESLEFLANVAAA